VDKYKELYDLAREAAAQTEARFDQIDAKASTYLAVFTVLLGGAGYFVKWVPDQLLPPRDPLQWLLTILAIPTAGLVTATWVSLLQVLRVHQIRVLPFNEATVQYFRTNRLVDVYYNVARSLSEAWVANQAVNDRKLAKLTGAYRMMNVTVVLVLFFSLLYGIHVWTGGGGAG
jgi:hypothetical protein